MKSLQNGVPRELKLSSKPIGASLKDMLFCLHQHLHFLKSDESEQLQQKWSSHFLETLGVSTVTQKRGLAGVQHLLLHKPYTLPFYLADGSVQQPVYLMNSN